MSLQYRSLVVPALLAAATLVLAGCSGDDPAKDGETDLPLGPISQRMTDLEQRFDHDAVAAMNAALDESIAACMKEQGFDYTPQGHDGDDRARAAGVPDWGSAEFAETYGYGITTQEKLPGATTAPDKDPQVMDGAYQQALWGADDDRGDDGAWLPGGCFGEAVAQIGMDDPTASTVAQDLDDLTAQAEQDEAVVAALDGWATCMADEGYDYQTSDEAQRSFYDRLYADDEPVGDELKALQDDEIATAVADHACGADLERARAAALVRLETDYYADHKTEVDAYLVQLEAFLARG